MEGELLGVTATDALELGIDIGLLDCAISVGFRAPSRRCGSNGAARDAATVASRCSSASEDALDQFFAREPDALLSRRVEAAILDHANPRILDPHVLSAAFEAPIDEATPRFSAARRWRAAGAPRARADDRPATSGRAATTRPRASRCAPATPRRSRSSTARPAPPRPRRARPAYSTVHEGAVYLHLGEQYLVEALARGRAWRSSARRESSGTRRRRRSRRRRSRSRARRPSGSASSSTSAASR